MIFSEVNLARRPFANSRPVVRISIALWVLGALLAIANAFLYGRSLVGMEESEERIAAARTAIAEERERIASAEEALRGMALREQNEIAAYLNDRIDERTFPWSRLFDHLADVLPREVRLHNVRPRRFETTSGERARAALRDGAPTNTEELVGLTMTGQARTDEAMLELLDNLFASRWFENPQLSSETREPDNTLRFALAATYLPATIQARREAALALASVEEEPSAAPTVEDAVGDPDAPTRSGPSVPGSDSRTPGAVASSPPDRSVPAGPERGDEGGGDPRTESRERTTGVPSVVPVPAKPSASRPGGRR